MIYKMIDVNINKIVFFEIECNLFTCTNNCFGDCLNHESDCYKLIKEVAD